MIGFYLKEKILDRIYRIIRILFPRLSRRKPGSPIAFGDKRITHSYWH
jgi:hypothetical protein